MLNEVRVFDQKGNLKKVLSSKFLSKRHWKNFETSVIKKPVSKWIKKKLDFEYANLDYLNSH